MHIIISDRILSTFFGNIYNTTKYQKYHGACTLHVHAGSVAVAVENPSKDEQRTHVRMFNMCVRPCAC
jgi:hypothetical protein